jgi:uncharacterized protein with PIN domain
LPNFREYQKTRFALLGARRLHQLVDEYPRTVKKARTAAFRDLLRAELPRRCVVYATAKELSAPLLFLGQEFSQTDISRPFQYLFK